MLTIKIIRQKKTIFEQAPLYIVPLPAEIFCTYLTLSVSYSLYLDFGGTVPVSMQDYSASFTAGVGPSSSSPTPSYHSPSLPPSHLTNPTDPFSLPSSMYSPRVPLYAHMSTPLFQPQSPSPPTSMWQGGGGGVATTPGAEAGGVSGGTQEGGQTSPYSRLQSANNTGNYFSR